MIAVDTNVLSEFGNPRPHPAVIDWLAEQGERLFLPIVVLAEISYGVERMAEGRRKMGMRRIYADLFAGFKDRILIFDWPAAFAYAEFKAGAERVGRRISDIDCQIAAMAKVNAAAIATRNTKDFETTGLDLINPWGE